MSMSTSMVMTFFIGVITGVISMCMIQVSKEADRKSNIKGKCYYDKENKNNQLLEITKAIDLGLYIGDKFIGKEAEVATRVLNYFKKYYTDTTEK